MGKCGDQVLSSQPLFQEIACLDPSADHIPGNDQKVKPGSIDCQSEAQRIMSTLTNIQTNILTNISIETPSDEEFKNLLNVDAHCYSMNYYYYFNVLF